MDLLRGLSCGALIICLYGVLLTSPTNVIQFGTYTNFELPKLPNNTQKSDTITVRCYNTICRDWLAECHWYCDKEKEHSELIIGESRVENFEHLVVPTMTEALQRLPIKPPKRVHFAELRPTRRQNTPQKPVVNSRPWSRIKGGSKSPPPNIPPSQATSRQLYSVSSSTVTSRDSNLPRKSAMKTIAPVIFPQQQQLSEQAKKPKKTTKELEEELKAKIITPSIFSAPQQQEAETTDEDEPIEPIVEVKKQTTKKSTKKVKEPEEDLSKQLIMPVIFSAPSPPKQVEEEEDPKTKKEKSLSKKNSSNATSPLTKHKSPIRDESVTEKDGITPELIKKVAALKPLIDNATSNTDLKADELSRSRKNGEKTAASKKGSGDDKSSTKSKNGSVKSNSSSKSNGLETDSAAAQIVLSKLKSSDVTHNALNFSAIQQQQRDAPPTSAGRKNPSKKL